MRSPLHLARPAWILAAHLALFSLARLVLYWTWRTDFADLSRAELWRAFLFGVVFDASVITVCLSPVILALLLPFEFARRRVWRTTWTWIAFVHLCVAALVLAGDVAYFGVVRRHVGPEIVALVDDPTLLISIVQDGYLVEAAAVLFALAGLFIAWRRSMRWDEQKPALRAPAWSLLVLAPLLLVVVRGNASGKPMSVVDAFQSGSVSSGYLALNGPFSIVHSVFGAQDVARDFMSWDDAVNNVQAQVFCATERALDPEYPLLRASLRARGQAPNVVVLLLESWDAEVVDALREHSALAPLGVTPNFDALARQGVLYTNFFAAGQRSTHGLLAVLAGMPSLPGMPYLGRGVEQSRLSFLGQLALAEGYSTFFLQGSNERSFRVDSIAGMAGFESYLGKQGIVERRGTEPMGEWGAWDHDLLRTAHEQFAAARAPFLGFAFTTSTHVPYQVPEDYAAPYPSDSAEHAYWNSVHYADWALGEFFASARSAGYFDDTIFVLVADHRSPVAVAGKSAPQLHHIPCLIIAPGLEPRVDQGIASQLDLLPSIADLARWRTPQATAGRSLFDAGGAAFRGALCMRNEIVLRIEADGWVSHDLTRRLDASAYRGGADLDAIERRMLATVQVVGGVLRDNRVLPAGVCVPLTELGTR